MSLDTSSPAAPPAPGTPGTPGTPDEGGAPSRPRLGRVVLLGLIAAVVVGGPAVALATLGQRGSSSYGDSAEVGRNRLSSATVDIEIGPATAPLVGEHVAPGDVLTTTVELVNAGSVSLRYSLSVTGDGDTRLAPWLTWSFVPSAGGSCPGADAWRAAPPEGATVVDGARVVDGAVAVLGDPTPGADPGDRVLEVGAAERLCVAMSVDLDAPNSVQDVQASLTLTADAEQLTDAERRTATASTGSGTATTGVVAP